MKLLQKKLREQRETLKSRLSRKLFKRPLEGPSREMQGKFAKRIRVGSANKLPLNKLINVYLHPPNVWAPVTAAGLLR